MNPVSPSSILATRHRSNGVKRTLIVFAKEPENGRVKTRLRKHFSDSRLIELYKAFLKDTIDISEKVKCEEKILAYSSRQEPLFLKRIGRSFRFHRQKGKDLGMRMHNAFLCAKNNNAEKMVIIGSDSPTLPHDSIQRAFDELDRYDIVLGPATDGGYYLVGLKDPCVALFKGIRWSRRTVLDKTLNKAKHLGKKITQLKGWYDVDDHDSLVRLKSNLIKEKDKGAAKYTKRFLKI